MRPRVPGSSAYVRALAVVGGYDIAVTIPLVGLWWLLGVFHLGLAVVWSALRILAWALSLRALLAPVREWEAKGQDCDDQQLLAADAALQRLHARFFPGYAVGWVVMFTATVLCGALGVAGGVPLLEAELVTGGLILLALVIVTPDTLTSLLRTAVLGVQTEISVALVERRIDPGRPHISMGRAATRKNSSLVLGLIIALVGLGGLLRVHEIRRTDVTEQQRRVEVSALRSRAELGPALEGVELLTRAELPEILAAKIDPSSPEPLALFDADRGVVVAAAPVEGAQGGRWAFSAHEPDEELDQLLLIVLGLAAAAAIPAGLAGWAEARALAEPIEQLDAATRGFLERGELRELARIAPTRNDEVGRLAGNFNAMLDILEELALAAQAVAEGDLSVALSREGDLHDAFRAMVERLNETVLRLRETSLELASAAAELHAITAQQDEATQQQSTSVQQVSANVISLANAANNVAETSKSALVDARQAVETTHAMARRIADLRRQTASITELLEAIREIADRSDLLALNGSLEATRAGEAGRGFALVAAEMRRLAERVTGTVADVREKVGDIEAAGAATVLATEEGRKLAQQTAAAAQKISDVTEEQSEATEEAARGMQEVAEIVVSASHATSQARAAAEGLRIHAVELERLTGTFTLRGSRKDE